MHDPVVIVSAARTPMGGFMGDFAALNCAQLGSVAIKAAVARAGLKPEQVDEVIMGCVLPAAPGRARRRAAAGGRVHHGEQDVRLRHARRDVRA